MLANIILLAHVLILCQHDHDTIICACFLTEPCTDNEDPLGADNQQHDEECPMEESPIKVDLYVRHANIKSLFDFCLDGTIHYTVLFLVLNSTTVENTDLEGLLLLQKRYLPTCHTDYISHSLGLRAPPVC
jgi:hypothetical protein